MENLISLCWNLLVLLIEIIACIVLGIVIVCIIVAILDFIYDIFKGAIIIIIRRLKGE